MSSKWTTAGTVKYNWHDSAAEAHTNIPELRFFLGLDPAFRPMVLDSSRIALPQNRDLPTFRDNHWRRVAQPTGSPPEIYHITIVFPATPKK